MQSGRIRTDVKESFFLLNGWAPRRRREGRVGVREETRQVTRNPQEGSIYGRGKLMSVLHKFIKIYFKM